MPQRPRTFHNSEYENFELRYTKLSDDAALSMVTKSMDLTVCPHAHYYYDSSATACKNYVTNWVPQYVVSVVYVVCTCGLTWSPDCTWPELMSSQGVCIRCVDVTHTHRGTRTQTDKHVEVVNVSFTDTKLAVTAIKVTHADLTTSEVKGTGSDISVSNGA